MKKSTIVLILATLLVLGVWVFRPWAGVPRGEPVRVTPASAAVGSQEPVATRQQAHEDWEVFRTTFPLHLQTLAVARDAAGSARTLIISEPPPRVTLAGLKEAAPRELGAAEVEQWTVGFDGWVRDVVVPLPRTDEKTFESLRDKLSTYLYGTSYKAFAIEIPVDPAALAMSYPLDVRVSTANLEGWYDSVGFVPVEGPAGSQVLLRDAPLGVFMSKEPGLVAWVAPKSGLERCGVECRKFAIDSDLILGAVGRGESVVIFGRERVAPYAVLPPLRAETVMDLAAARESSLSQSYERPLFGAGWTERGWDWAPIYLSDVLLDSEYGSLLNQADQMLKSWTFCGLVEYHNFLCVAPTRMPFDRPLIEQLDASELLFNWNTTGFGVGSEEGERKLYAVTRTGALPVTYRADNGEKKDPKTVRAIARAEDQAYQYFASLDNPVLARVVQYASLYQMFKANGVSALPRATPSWDQGAALERLVGLVFPRLRDMSKEACDRALDLSAAEMAERERVGDEKPNLAALERGRLEWRTEGRESLAAFRKYDRAIDADERKMLVRLLARTRTSDLDLEELRRYLKSHPGVLLLAGATQDALDYGLFGRTELQQAFSATRPATASGWTRTPTIVYSRATGSVRGGTGGHNVGSKPFNFVRDAAQPAGTVRVGADGRVFVNPGQAGVLERYGRQLACADNAQEVITKAAGLLKEAKPEPARSLEVVLARRADLPREIRGGSSRLHVQPAGGGAPPRKPPEPPGTLPPQGRGPDRDLFSMGPKDKEILVFERKNGIADIERRRNGVALGSPQKCWTDQDMAHVLLRELESSGRTIDGRPLEVVFGKSWSKAEVDNLMSYMALQVERRAVARPTLMYSPEAAAHLGEAVTGASGRTVSTKAGSNAAEVLVNITLRTQAEQDIRMAMTMRLREAVPEVRVREVAEHSVEAAVKQHVTHEAFPEEVRRRMVEELKALDEYSGGSSHIGDIGDTGVSELDGSCGPTRLAFGGEVQR